MLGIYTQYKDGELYLDASSYVVGTPEFTTNNTGFWYLTCSLKLNKEMAADLYKSRKVFHVWYGDGPNTFFEGRLEDVEYGNETKITAYGYIRAFSDLQVTDIWSTESYEMWHPMQTGQLSSLISTQWTYDQTNRLNLALNKNTTTPFAFSLGAFYTLGLQKSSRSITYAEFTLNIKDTTLTSIYAFLSRINGSVWGFTSLGAVYLKNNTASGFRQEVSLSFAASEALMFGMQFDPAATYAGETGNISMDISRLRLGSTPSISGGRLYADEVLKYTLSGVFTLNPNQINPQTDLIQCPARDIRELVFEDVTGLDVIQQLLLYPDSNGNFYECKVWEDQKVIFRPQRTSYKTWVVDIEDITLIRTLEGTINNLRGVYSQKITFKGNPQYVITGYVYDTQPGGGIIGSTGSFVWQDIDTGEETRKRTNYYINQSSVDTYGLNRQGNIIIPTSNDTTADTKTQQIINIQTSRTLKTQINVTYVLDEYDSRHDARKVRSGDKIIIRNVPPSLSNELENTFYVTETKWSNGVMTITPAQPIDQIENILG